MNCTTDMTFEKELTKIINRFSEENASNTPDYILAQYMNSCLSAFNTATQQRETWYERDSRPSNFNKLTPPPHSDG